jgi:flagellin
MVLICRRRGSAAERGSQVAAAVNTKSSQTGVTATYDTTTGAVSLTAADGRNITLEKAATASSNDVVTGITTGGAAGAASSKTVAGEIALSSTNANGIQVSNGAEASISGAAVTANTAIASGDIVINGQNIGAVKAGATVSVQGQNVADAINAVSSKTGVAASTLQA